MEETVRAFNRLPRPQTTTTGLPNHWVFRVRHVPLQPPGDLLVVVHTTSEFMLHAGPAQVLSLPLSEKADAIVKMLLDTFIKGERDPTGRQTHEPWSPWTWATDDKELATAIETKLKDLGVCKELCRVGMCTADEKDIIDAAWSGLVGVLMKMMGQDARTKKARKAASTSQSMEPGDASLCHCCSTSGDLKKCSACGLAWYCSQDCQKTHWKQHKPLCLAKRPSAHGNSSAASSSTARTSKFTASTYYNTIAHTVPEAKHLAQTINLSLPSSQSTFSGTEYPLRRLVVTGKDTPENLQLLFGPNWSSDIQGQHGEARIGLLLNPPRGSPAYALNAANGQDNGAPGYSPRAASETEQKKVDEVREMQRLVQQRIARGQSPSDDDMVAILTQFGANWVEQLPTYMLAINAMDQGVRPS